MNQVLRQDRDAGLLQHLVANGFDAAQPRTSEKAKAISAPFRIPEVAEEGHVRSRVEEGVASRILRSLEWQAREQSWAAHEHVVFAVELEGVELGVIEARGGNRAV